MCAFYDFMIVVVSHNKRAIAKESSLSHYYCRFSGPKKRGDYKVTTWLGPKQACGYKRGEKTLRALACFGV